MSENNGLLAALFARRRRLAILLYACAAFAAYFSAYLLRFDFRPPGQYLQLFAWTVWPFVAIRLGFFRIFRLTRERWRYAGASNIPRLVLASVSGSLVFLVVFRFVLPLDPVVPISVVAMETVLVCWFTAGMWLSYRLGYERLRQHGHANGHDKTRVLLVGAGEAGNLLIREMIRFPTGYRPVGIVDDDPTMWGATLHGVEVIGATRDLVPISKSIRAEEIIIAVPSASPADLRRIVAKSEATGLPLKVLPGIAEVLGGDVRLNQVREVRIEDLLGREPVELELPALTADMDGATVLITGAAGSIGSELARQVALNTPRTLVLLDQAESDLFYLDLELRRANPKLEIIPIIADIVDAAAMRAVFENHAPDRVFHAAAYKHVPLMECNSREAIQNNVIGTWRVAELAGSYGVEKFVLVSTDKAVRPANVMGATKRLAELIILEMQTRHPGTNYGAVRFGNVLGSNGSVIPVFRRQLKAGQPLTVTDPETTRYFMTIPEAVQLILQASLLPELRGHVAMLDMGEPVRILDLAENLLRLSGVTDYRGRIVFTGLRPGEKLHEELAAPDEETSETAIEKIRIIRSVTGPVRVLPRLSLWERGLDGGDPKVLRQDLDAFFPGLPMRLQTLDRLPMEVAVGD
ncbi:MAG: polysaccharide biosynthesis protein [Longimicrobiales bacterium]